MEIIVSNNKKIKYVTFEEDVCKYFNTYDRKICGLKN